MTHRQRLLFQSTCIILPLALLAVLAAWQLTDAQKLAKSNAQEETEKYIKRIERRLEESFELLIDESTHWPQDSIKRQLYPLVPIPASTPDHKIHERYLNLLDDRSRLLNELPAFSKEQTPSGLPLEPLARWRLIELGQNDPESFASFFRSITEDHPSILTATLLSKAAKILSQDDLLLCSTISNWEKSEHLRSLIRPLGDDFPSTKNPWLGETKEFWHSSRRGGVVFIPSDSLSQLASTILQSEANDRPRYLNVSISLTSNTSSSPFKTTSVIIDDDAILADYRKQRTRHLLLIGLSTIIAIIGWVALCRSHRRQIEIGEMKSNFVSSVSHELRAPVASIRLLAERLRSGKVKEDTKRDEYYNFIEGESQRLSTLVENVLDFSHIEKGIKQYHLEDADLTELTRAAVTTMKHRATEHEVQIMTSIPNKEVPVQVDTNEIHGALVNLIDNAIKFSTKGDTVSVGLDIETDTQDENPMIKLWVLDNGPGVPSTESEKIFDRFYRSGSELTRKTQGAGIGLSIVRHIIHGHGGQVTVKRPTEGGSLFTITLPYSPNYV